MTTPRRPGGVVEIEPHTCDKPEIYAIAAELGLERDAALGAVVRVWSWFTTHTADGVAPITPDTLDAAIGCRGIANALAAVGWLRYQSGRLEVPEFGEHCRPRAGARSADTRRAQRLIERRGGDPVDQVTTTTPADTVSPAPQPTPANNSERPNGSTGPARESRPKPHGPVAGPDQVPTRSGTEPERGAALITGKPVTGTTGDLIKTGNPVTGRKPGDYPNYLQRVGVRDLLDVGALSNLLAALCRDSPIDGLHATDQSLRLIVGAAIRALEVGKNPPALFASLVGGRRWELITADQDDRAAEHVRTWRRTGDGTFAAGKYPRPSPAASSPQ